MTTKHDCWWTRHHQSELTDAGDAITGAGCPAEVLESAARWLSTELQRRPSRTDEYGEEISMGAVASGSSHDGCFFELRPASASLKRALVGSILQLHAMYLGRQVDWSGVVDGLTAQWAPGASLRIRTLSGQQRLTVQSYPQTSNALRRWFAESIIVDCTGPQAVML